jgi:hypothetical protein
MCPLVNEVELFQLVDRLCDNDMTPEQHARFKRLVASNPAVFRICCDHFEMHLLLWLVFHRRPDDIAPARS